MSHESKLFRSTAVDIRFELRKIKQKKETVLE